MIGIFGAGGAIGKSVAAEAQRRGIRLRVVGRHAASLEKAYGGAHEIVIADLGDPDDVMRAAQGLDAIVHAIGVPYNRFDLHPKIMRQVVDAARRSGVARLLLVSNVYSYGAPQTGRVAEDHPRRPTTYKGKMRKEQEDVALGADSAALHTAVLRLPDFFGPDAEFSLTNEIFKSAKTGKSAAVIAPIDTPHEFVFTPDVGPVVLDLLARDDVYGQAYNFAGPGTMTMREFATRVYEGFGKRPQLAIVRPWMLYLIGMFSPFIRELIEMEYLQKTPVLLDDSKLQRTLGELKKTSYEDGIARTVAALATR